MPDRLTIEDLQVSCRLGVYEWEQATPQTIWVDLELTIDAAWAAAREDVEAAVDYGRLVTVVKQHAERTSHRLMETLAEEIAALILAEFGVPEVRVRVKKKALPGIGHAAVEIHRAAGSRTNGKRSRARPRRMTRKT